MNRSRHRIARLLLSSLCVFAAGRCASLPESKKDNGQVIEAVRAVIEAQQAAWNKGDIERFMEGYERAETTTFISGDEIMRGWQSVLERYKRRYSSPRQMGKLSFSEIDIQPLSANNVLVNGRWQLVAGNDTPHGRFTLLFRQTSNGWRIIHDTTTSAQ